MKVKSKKSIKVKSKKEKVKSKNGSFLTLVFSFCLCHLTVELFLSVKDNCQNGYFLFLTFELFLIVKDARSKCELFIFNLIRSVQLK